MMTDKEIIQSEGLPIELEQDAKNGKELPSGLGYPEQILYLELRMLYDQWKKQIVPTATAAVEKKRLLDEYRCYKLREKIGEEWEQALKETDLARAAYRKERTLGNADKLLDAIEGTKFRRI